MSNIVPIIGGAGGGSTTITPISITGTPPAATKGVPYTFTPTIANVTGNVRAQLIGGLPNGLSLNSSTGVVSGTPVTEQTVTNWGITVRDDFGTASLFGLSLTVGSSVLLPKLAAAKAAVIAGTRNGRILCFGDSTVWGYGAAGASFGNNLKAGAWPAKLADLIANGSHQAWFGNGDTGAANRYGVSGADARLNLSAFGIGGGSKVGLGQFPFLFTAAATGTFTPGKPVDTVESYFLTDTTNGVGTFTFDTNVDGGASLGISGGALAEAFRKTTFTFPLGTHAINTVWASGNAYLSGQIAYNSAVKEMTVINAGAAGARITDIATPSSAARQYSPLNSIAVLQPDAVLTSMTINDAATGTAIPTFQAGLQTLDDKARAANADHVYITGVPGDPTVSGRPSFATQQSYVDAFKAIATANGRLVVDIFAEFVDFPTANAKGWMNDAIHPSALGYQIIAQKVSAVLNAA